MTRQFYFSLIYKLFVFTVGGQKGKYTFFMFYRPYLCVLLQVLLKDKLSTKCPSASLESAFPVQISFDLLSCSISSFLLLNEDLCWHWNGLRLGLINHGGGGGGLDRRSLDHQGLLLGTYEKTEIFTKCCKRCQT